MIWAGASLKSQIWQIFTQKNSRVPIGINKVRLGALLIVICHPAFWLECTLAGEPYENLPMRLAMMASAVPLFFWATVRKRFGKSANSLYFAVMCVNLIFYTPWMYMMNGTATWLASAMVSIVLCFGLIGLRSTVVWLLPGYIAAYWVAQWMGTQVPVKPTDLVTVVYAIIGGMWLSFIVQARAMDKESAAKIMVGLMVHDLRTPISTVQILSEVLVSENSTPEVQSTARRLLLAARSMQAVVDDQVQAAGLTLDDEVGRDFMASEVIREACNEYAESISEEPVHIGVDIQNDFKLHGARAQFKRVIVNLIKNSHQAVSKNSRGEKIIAIEAHADSTDGEILVSDNGSGITEENLPHIFRPFFTTSPSAKRGMGLYYVRYVTENLLGGEITASSTPGESTTFRLVFPIGKEKAKSKSHEETKFLDTSS